MGLGFQFYHYAVVSTVACAFLLTHAFIRHAALFDLIVYLSSAKLSIAILNNFAFMCFLSIGRLFVKIFVGRLRDLEIEELLDSGRGFLMDTILFLVLSTPTIDGQEVATVGLLKHIILVVALKIFHLIAQIRVAHLFEVGVPRRDILMRLLGLMLLLVIVDVGAISHFWSKSSKNSTFYVWTVFECLGMLATAVVNLLKYTVHWVDTQLDSGWPAKNALVFYFDLVHDVISLTIFLTFMVVFFVNNPSRLPLYMTADILQVLRTLLQRVRSFQKYRQLTRNMDKRFPDATAAELAESDRCIICRDVLTPGAKKLPCGHVFHMDCVKSWFVQQQSCPTCRAEVQVNSVNVSVSPPNPEEELPESPPPPSPPAATSNVDPTTSTAAIGGRRGGGSSSPSRTDPLPPPSKEDNAKRQQQSTPTSAAAATTAAVVDTTSRASAAAAAAADAECRPSPGSAQSRNVISGFSLNWQRLLGWNAEGTKQMPASKIPAETEVERSAALSAAVARYSRRLQKEERRKDRRRRRRRRRGWESRRAANLHSIQQAMDRAFFMAEFYRQLTLLFGRIIGVGGVGVTNAENVLSPSSAPANVSSAADSSSPTRMTTMFHLPSAPPQFPIPSTSQSSSSQFPFPFSSQQPFPPTSPQPPFPSHSSQLPFPFSSHFPIPSSQQFPTTSFLPFLPSPPFHFPTNFSFPPAAVPDEQSTSHAHLSGDGENTAAPKGEED